MKTKIFLLSVLTLTLLSFDLPKGWFKAGTDPKSYEMGIDKDASIAGKNVVTIKSNEKNINGFGTLMQTCLPGKYLGKRVRMSGMMKSKDVSNWAAFWFRVDGPDAKQSLSFDNMQDRPIKGTSDWKKYEIVLDVPLKATSLNFGALLASTGQIWFSDLKFEIVDNSVPTTDNGANSMPLPEPTNLDFQN